MKKILLSVMAVVLFNSCLRDPELSIKHDWFVDVYIQYQLLDSLGNNHIDNSQPKASQILYTEIKTDLTVIEVYNYVENHIKTNWICNWTSINEVEHILTRTYGWIRLK